MRLCFSALTLTLFAEVVEADTMRWGRVSKQGEIDIAVSTADGSALMFTCPEGYPGQKVGIGVHARGQIPNGPANTLKIIVGAQTFSYRLEADAVFVTDRETETSVNTTVDALLGSKSRTFIAEIPELKWRQEFPLTNIKAAMDGVPGKNIISRCKP
jgi:hypothetical protein